MLLVCGQLRCLTSVAVLRACWPVGSSAQIGSLCSARSLPILIVPAAPLRPTKERRVHRPLPPLTCPLEASKPLSSVNNAFRPPPRSSLPLKPNMLVPHSLPSIPHLLPRVPLAPAWLLW